MTNNKELAEKIKEAKLISYRIRKTEKQLSLLRTEIMDILHNKKIERFEVKGVASATISERTTKHLDTKILKSICDVTDADLECATEVKITKFVTIR